MNSTTLLTIAGFDPSSGAGITADLAVFAAHGYFGTSSITALTVQSTLGVRATHPVSSQILAATLACLEDDIPAAGIKIGMLSTAENVHAVADFLERRLARGKKVPVVLDPVLQSTSGRELLTPEGMEALSARLLPLADWVTPNRAELARLAGLPVAKRHEAERAARQLQARVPGLSVVVTGGDAGSPDDFVSHAGGTSYWLQGTRVESEATHGTGCAFSSALLCGLVANNGTAPKAAKIYVTEAIRRATRVGHGKGPLDLLWPLEGSR